MSRNIRKKSLINKVAQATDNTQEYTREVIERFLAEMIGELAKGNRLEFRGFGVFEVVMRKQKRARNPKTRQEVLVPPHKVVRFRMGKEMKNIL